jgi:signal transduction histidine kinase
MALVFLQISQDDGYVALVWPPAGLALAFMLLFGIKFWLAVAVGAVVASLFASTSAAVNLSGVVGATLEPTVAVYLLARAHFDKALMRVRDVLLLVFIAAFLSTLIGAMVGVAGYYLAGAFSISDYPDNFIDWWIADIIGILVIAPLVLLWCRWPLPRLSRRRIPEASALVTALVLVSVAVFHGVPIFRLPPFTFEFLVVPILIWSALRFMQPGNVMTIFITASIAIWAALTNLHNLHGDSTISSLLKAEIFMAVIAVAFMTLAATVSETIAAQNHQLYLVKRAARLAQQRARLIALNTAKDEFISITSHELRAPATAVKQYLGMVLQNYAGELTDVQRQPLEIAYESNERQLRAINDLLNVARIDTGNIGLAKEPVDVIHLIEVVIQSELANFESRQQTYKFHYRRNVKYVLLADKDKLTMAFGNLISNASKYSHPGTNIDIKISKTHDTISVSVTDQGVGMKKADIQKLFKKFSRIENALSVAVGGMGLGLYWTKRIIDLHGGTIEVISVPNQGSTFIATLPTASQVPANQVTHAMRKNHQRRAVSM